MFSWNIQIFSLVVEAPHSCEELIMKIYFRSHFQTFQLDGSCNLWNWIFFTAPLNTRKPMQWKINERDKSNNLIGLQSISRRKAKTRKQFRQ